MQSVELQDDDRVVLRRRFGDVAVGANSDPLSSAARLCLCPRLRVVVWAGVRLWRDFIG